jgi:hypothetical protein
MSRPIHERLRQLETEVQNLDVPPAAAVRARGHRRRRRQMAAVMVGVAAVATSAGITATRALDRPDRYTTLPGPAAGPAVRCVLGLPDDPAQVRVRVLDGGAPVGLGDTTEIELRERRFTVLNHTGDPATHRTGATTLRYGPAAIGAAALLRAELIGAATMEFDSNRADDTVDLTLGPTFVRLATSTELNQALVEIGEPSAPPGC